MTVSFEDLLIQTGYWLNQADALGGLAGRMDSFANASAEAKHFVNVAYRDMIHKLQHLTGKPFAVLTANLSWIAGQEQYDLPADFGTLQSIEAGWEAGNTESDRWPITQIDYSRRLNYYAANESYIRNGEFVPKRYFYIVSVSQSAIEKIGFVPIPIETLTNNITLMYWPFKTAMTAASDTIIKQFEEWQDVISVRAAILIMLKAEVDPSALVAIYQPMFNDWKDSVLDMTPNEPEVPEYYGTYE